MRLIITAKQMESVKGEVLKKAKSEGFEVEFHLPEGQGFSSNELLDFCGGAELLIAGDDQLDERFFEGATSLRRLVRWGVGTDSVDFKAAKKCGVSVSNVPGVLGPTVAEYALGLMLMLARRQHEVDQGIRAGNWPKPIGRQLRGSSLGLLGFGNIGRELAEVCQALGMDIYWVDPQVVDSPNLVGSKKDLNFLMNFSDYLVVTCPASSSTLGLIDRAFLQGMKKSACVISVSRGGIVVEEDLNEALSGGELAGAALDVFSVEPLPIHSPLRYCPNLILGSHNASSSQQAIKEVSLRAIALAFE